MRPNSIPRQIQLRRRGLPRQLGHKQHQDDQRSHTDLTFTTSRLGLEYQRQNDLDIGQGWR
jgi:hypothetical protein